MQEPHLELAVKKKDNPSGPVYTLLGVVQVVRMGLEEVNCHQTTYRLVLLVSLNFY